MNKDEILEKTFGHGIVVLVKEARRTARDSQNLHLRIADSLRQMFGALCLAGKRTSNRSRERS